MTDGADRVRERGPAGHRRHHEEPGSPPADGGDGRRTAHQQGGDGDETAVEPVGGFTEWELPAHRNDQDGEHEARHLGRGAPAQKRALGAVAQHHERHARQQRPGAARGVVHRQRPQPTEIGRPPSRGRPSGGAGMRRPQTFNKRCSRSQLEITV
ncbi:MAG: hypothetical protein ACLFU0_00680 [Alphaproteobacteria bacterium]